MYYASGAPLSWWITEIEIDPLALAIRDSDTGKTYSVPVHVAGGAITFGEPVETEPQAIADG
jgi:hypothetical protein